MKRILSSLVFALFASLLTPTGCDKLCSSHDDCDDSEWCIFDTGRCAAKCDPSAADPCPGGGTCGSCATSACPTCKDCRAACETPVSQGQQGAQGGW